jgi:outer membrane protein TolC
MERNSGLAGRPRPARWVARDRRWPVPCLLACMALVSGCGTQDWLRADTGSGEAIAHRSTFSNEYVLSGAYLSDWQSALGQGTALDDLALRADAIAIERSPSLFELRAAEAESAAARAAWFPRVRPVATAGFGGVSTGVGLSITQLIHDFGQTRNRREQAEISRVLAELDFWAERNDDVLEALTAYVDAVEANEIILARSALEQRLAELAVREEERLQAGVVAQGDALFIDVSRQENRRELIRARADLAEARAELEQDTGIVAGGQLSLRFSALDGACHPPERREYSPELLRAQIAVELRRLEEIEARRGLFPSVEAEATVLAREGGGVDDQAQITLEGGNLAGGGGRLRIEAAAQRVFALERELSNILHDQARDWDRLEARRRLLASQLFDFRDLIRTNERSLDLFRDRFAAGAASTSEAARLETERTANVIGVIETRSDMARNCLEAARLFGALSRAEIGSP